MEFSLTGIVTTARITHATPAGAYAHTTDRLFEDDNSNFFTRFPCQDDIAKQLIFSEIGQKLKVRNIHCKTGVISDLHGQTNCSTSSDHNFPSKLFCFCVILKSGDVQTPFIKIVISTSHDCG